MLKRKITISLLLFVLLLAAGWLGNANLASLRSHSHHSGGSSTVPYTNLSTTEAPQTPNRHLPFFPREYVRINNLNSPAPPLPKSD
ncbi:hypothetical protein [Paenibacillus oceani]|uniref:Uncharacterized protein n=1 Tax=Paenibacillus oceani TaxID=2772510 RepID=A0A927CA92_9BACL|nr:hypothetical protein [Paenibacillus oceani]MBD2862331.1 hypothetical protein [Paenibacillus oceani]